MTYFFKVSEIIVRRRPWAGSGFIAYQGIVIGCCLHVVAVEDTNSDVDKLMSFTLSVTIQGLHMGSILMAIFNWLVFSQVNDCEFKAPWNNKEITL